MSPRAKNITDLQDLGKSLDSPHVGWLEIKDPNQQSNLNHEVCAAHPRNIHLTLHHCNQLDDDLSRKLLVQKSGQEVLTPPLGRLDGPHLTSPWSVNQLENCTLNWSKFSRFYLPQILMKTLVS
jgi:hypothetical protein